MKMKSVLRFALLLMAVSIFATAEDRRPAPASAPWESMILSTPAPVGECHDPSQFPLGVPPDFAPDGYQFLFSPTVTSGADCGIVLTGGLQFSTSVDSARFNNPANFKLVANMNVLWDGSVAHTMCVRLYNLTDSAPVTGSEVCRTAAVGQSQIFRAESAAFALPAGSHIYTIQARAVAVPDSDGIVRFESGFVMSARLVN